MLKAGEVQVRSITVDTELLDCLLHVGVVLALHLLDQRDVNEPSGVVHVHRHCVEPVFLYSTRGAEVLSQLETEHSILYTVGNELRPVIEVILHDPWIERHTVRPGLVLTRNGEQFDQAEARLELVTAQQLRSSSLELSGSAGSTSEHSRINEGFGWEINTHPLQHCLLEACVVRHDDAVVQGFFQQHQLVRVVVHEVEAFRHDLTGIGIRHCCYQRTEEWTVDVVVQPVDDQIRCGIGLEVKTYHLLGVVHLSS